MPTLQDVVTAIHDIPEDDPTIKSLKIIINGLVSVVGEQNQKLLEQGQIIDQLRKDGGDTNVQKSNKTRNIEQIQKDVTQEFNDVHEVSERVLELENYSRKLCLILSPIAIGEDINSAVMSILNGVLQLNIGPLDLAACHALAPGPLAPVIIKFIYHSHRDLALRRRHWLKEIPKEDI